MLCGKFLVRRRVVIGVNREPFILITEIVSCASCYEAVAIRKDGLRIGSDISFDSLLVQGFSSRMHVGGMSFGISNR